MPSRRATALLFGLSALMASPASAQSVSAVTTSKPAAACDVDIPVTVTLAEAAAQPVTVQFSSSVPATVTAPAPATIATGQRTAAVRFPCTPTTQSLTVSLGASVGASSQSALVNVLPPALRSLSFKPDARATADLPPTSFTGSVELEGPAPTSGAIVTLSGAASTAASVPATITVRGGDRRATFAVTNVRPVSAATPVTVTASAFGATRNATFTALPATPRELRVSDARGALQASITAGGNVDVRLRLVLNDVAGPGGTPVTVTSSAPALVVAPTDVRVPAGDSVVLFSARTSAATSSGTASLTATVGTVSRSVQIAIDATQLSSVTLPTLVGGDEGSGSVSLTGPAPAGGLEVTLSSSTPNLTVPPSITIAAGQRSTGFLVRTNNVEQSTPATVTASVGTGAGAARVTASTTIGAEGLSDFSIAREAGGAGNRFTAQLTAPKGHDGFTIALAGSPTTTITPATVRFGANETSKSVAFTVTPVAQRTEFTVTARLAPTLSATNIAAMRTATPTSASSAAALRTVQVGVPAPTRSASISALPPAVQRVALSVTDTVGGVRGSLSGTITLAGPAPSGYALELTTSNPAVAIDQPPVFAAGATSATFTVRTLAVNQRTTITITARPRDAASASATLTLRPR